MNEYFTPAVVPADPEANITDLLVDRLAATPDAPAVRAPHRRRRLERRVGRRVPPPGRRARQGPRSPPASQPGEKIGFMCKTRYEWTLIDFAAWFAGAVLVPIYETSAPAQIQFNLDRLGRDRDHRRDRRALRPVRRDAQRAAAGRRRSGSCGLGDLDKLVAGGTDGHRRRDREAPSARPRAPTSPRSSTPRGRPGARRAASSRTRTSSS